MSESIGERPGHLWCPICRIEGPLSQEEADRHVIRHIGEGRWPNANDEMLKEAICRQLCRILRVEPMTPAPSTTSAMVQKVALSIEEWLAEMGAEVTCSGGEIERSYVAEKMARAAIAAMREPTEAMYARANAIEAQEKANLKHFEVTGFCGLAYLAMIDEALK